MASCLVRFMIGLTGRAVIEIEHQHRNMNLMQFAVKFLFCLIQDIQRVDQHYPYEGDPHRPKGKAKF